MAKKLIDFHKEWSEAGEITDPYPNGLCDEFELTLENRYRSEFLLLIPTKENVAELKSADYCDAWWGSDMMRNDPIGIKERIYGPLRQTIVLLICAMKGEI